MTHEKLTSIAPIAVTLALLCIHPDSIVLGIALVASLAVFAVICLADKHKDNQIAALRAEIKTVHDQVQGLMIGRSLNR